MVPGQCGSERKRPGLALPPGRDQAVDVHGDTPPAAQLLVYLGGGRGRGLAKHTEQAKLGLLLVIGLAAKQRGSLS